MFLTLTMKADSGSADIRIDSEQTLGAGLGILRESGQLPPGNPPDYFRSHLNEVMVSAYQTFEEASIFDGDILTAVG